MPRCLTNQVIRLSQTAPTVGVFMGSVLVNRIFHPKTSMYSRVQACRLSSQSCLLKHHDQVPKKEQAFEQLPMVKDLRLAVEIRGADPTSAESISLVPYQKSFVGDWCRQFWPASGKYSRYSVPGKNIWLSCFNDQHPSLKVLNNKLSDWDSGSLRLGYAHDPGWSTRSGRNLAG